MLKKRIIGVVTVKNGWAVQSFGYHRYLPLGKPECLVENFNRWGADEILVQVIDRSMARVGPDYELLGKLAQLGSGTPLIYGGGIRTVDEGVRVIQSGADRLSVDTLLHEDLSVVLGLSDRLGMQAIIASLPMGIGTNGLEWFNYRSKVSAPVSSALVEVIEAGKVSEVLLTDWKHEGSPVGFDSALVDLFQCKKAKLILFGGISCAHQMKSLLAYSNVAAVSLGNFLSYREHAIQQFKEKLSGASLRPAIYTTENSTASYV